MNHIRDFHHSDLDTVAHLINAASLIAYGTFGWSRTVDETRAMLEDATRAFDLRCVIVRASSVCGFMSLQGSFIDLLFVKPDQQGQGLGHGLITHAKRLHPPGLTLWCAEPNIPARQFYSHRGFVEGEIRPVPKHNINEVFSHGCHHPEGRVIICSQEHLARRPGVHGRSQASAVWAGSHPGARR